MHGGAGVPTKQYLVKWGNLPEEMKTWEPAKNLEAELVAAYEKAARGERGVTYHVCSPAQSALEGPEPVPRGEGAGDGAGRAAEPLVCNTQKGVEEERRFARTAGAVYCVTNCGMIFWVWELFGSEALKQVYYGLKEMVKGMEEQDLELPLAGAYDDACHLLLFLLR